jgi:hypothetical protein
MPGKHVHFGQNTYHTAAYKQSPAVSDVSLPDSDGPFTPPPFGEETLPVIGERGAASSKGPEYRVHTALALRQQLAGPIVGWDVSTMPVSSAALENVLGHAATSPPLPELRLSHQLLPFEIIVRAGDAAKPGSPYAGTTPLPGTLTLPGTAAASAGVVTVADVLLALYAALRSQVEQDEYARLPQAHRLALDNAYHARVARFAMVPAQKKAEADKGIKRIDYLIAAGQTRFTGLGLFSVKGGSPVWGLNFA